MVELCGKPLTFGDADQIAAVRRLEREAEEKELKKKYGCLTCATTGEAEQECDECEGTGVINGDCEDCDGKGYNEPEEKKKS